MKKETERPVWVEKARLTDDLEVLRYAARKSHEAQARNKDRRAEEDQYYRERQVTEQSAEAARLAEIDREHIVPLDADIEKEA